MSKEVVTRDFLLPLKLEIGDLVQTRDLDNLPDGTRGKVLGFGTVAYGRTNIYGVEPGIYTDYYTVKVSIDVAGLTTPFLIRITNLALDGDAERVAMREVARRMVSNLPAKEAILLHRTKEKNLPEFTLSELDRVYVFIYGEGTITRVEYNKNPVQYTVQLDKTGERKVFESYDVCLTSRGNVWKHQHGGILVFGSLLEEGNFFISVGDAEEIRNPTTGDYIWSPVEVLRAIRNGDADGFTDDQVFGYIVYRYNDRELGDRIANLILSGHGQEGRFEMKEHKYAVQA